MRIGAILTAAAMAFGLVLTSTDADAQRRRRRRGRSQQPQRQETPHSDAIAPAISEIQWGWSRQELLNYFTQKIRQDYRDRIREAPGAIEADAIRHERDQRIQRVRRSVTEFRGQTSGYDSGFLRDEFSHNNNESMIRVRSDNADDFYFFINDRLWKWYRAFDASVFRGADWPQFQQALQGRFGPSVTRNGAIVEGGEEREWIEWQDDTTRARALDNTTFYGFYCLVFEEKATLNRLDELRTNRSRRGRGSHALVDAVTMQESGGDANSNIVDRITGNIRVRENAPEEDGDMSSMRRR